MPNSNRWGAASTVTSRRIPRPRHASYPNRTRWLPRIPLAPALPDQSPERKRRVKGGGPVACAPGSDESADPAPGFRAFAKAGKQLAKLHIEYESLEPWPASRRRSSNTAFATAAPSSGSSISTA